jgi:transposase
MITVAPQSRILVHTETLDFRKGLDKISCYCKTVLKEDPFSGTYFLFTNRKRTDLKILFYDGQGFWLFHKRFSKGTIKHWPKKTDCSPSVIQLAARELQTLLWNGNMQGANFAPEWKKVVCY